MEAIKSLFSFILKLTAVLIVAGVIGVAVLAFFLKQDVKEIREFTERLKKEIDAEPNQV